MPSRLLNIFALTFSLIVMTGCTDPPQERLEAAWVAAEDERFEDFMAHFSADSRALVRGLAETKTRTKRAFEYIESPFDLIPRGEILSIDERDALILVEVKAKEPYTLRMVSEGGMWVIDARSLATMWAPLAQGEEQ